MTTIFALKAKNAWVLMADRFATNNLYLEDGIIDRPYQSLLVDIENKIIIHKDEIIFSGCGDQERITDLAEEISKNCSNAEDCKKYIDEKIGGNRFEGRKEDRPKLIIISKSDMKCILVNFQETNNVKRISEVNQSIVLGGGERSINKAIVMQDIAEIINKDIAREDSKSIAIRCAKLLDKIWLGLHKDDLKLTGPPCFTGCDICIVWSDEIAKIMVQPKDYEII